jgi:hypothetical protein
MVLVGLLGILLFGAWSYQAISGNLFGTTKQKLGRNTHPRLFWGVLAVEFLAMGWGLTALVQRLMTP